ncbi:FecR family protein [Hymenobacter sp. GOD-10R]|uniref:FecR family protein n=1 Tax=Hymenobacter sp. GOD-10R TaxID=3093922 RepID=UPI002D79E7CB|nr:FecR domain-containing protein [Hymenobacter sp. GOD-10R]WRQ26152.1 FecR domain-containing protein [Hymenobacter sp. GOD-10R]
MCVPARFGLYAGRNAQIMTDEEYFLLYEKYLLGHSTAEERHRLRQAPQAQNQLPELSAAEEGHLASAPAREAVLSRLLDSIEHAEVHRPSRAKRWQWATMAAVVALLVVAGSYWLVPTLWQSRLHYATGYGQQQRIVLPDGSEVVLNANSTLETPAVWDPQARREVWLHGEAYFIVAHKAAPSVRTIAQAAEPLKFVVHSGPVDVAVLGTKFNVNSRADDTRVVLAEGKVQLTAPGQPALLMKPGELVDFAPTHAAYATRKVNPGLYTAWKEHHYIFDDTPLPEIARLLEDTYGYKVFVQDKALLHKKLTGEINTKNPEVLLYALSKSFGIRIEKQGKTLRFYTAN